MTTQRVSEEEVEKAYHGAPGEPTYATERRLYKIALALLSERASLEAKVEHTKDEMTENVLRFLSTNHCAKHKAEVLTESLREFVEKTEGKCLRCLEARLAEARASFARECLEEWDRQNKKHQPSVDCWEAMAAWLRADAGREGGE